MVGLERIFCVFDVFGFFIVIWFLFIELFIFLMFIGEKVEWMLGVWIFMFRDILWCEYVFVYVNVVVFFFCGMGMILDFKRWKCVVVVVLYVVIYIVIVFFECIIFLEYLIVSIR